MNVRLAVVVYSATGNTHLLGAAAAEAGQKAGAQVRLRVIPDLVEHPPTTDEEASTSHRERIAHVPHASVDDLVWADAIMVGTPVRFGLPAAPVLHFVDTTAKPSIAGQLDRKVVSVFTSGSAPHGGQVSAILALHNAFCHWGALIVSSGSTEPLLFRPANGNPYGASNVSRNEPGNVDPDNLGAAEFLARRTVGIARALVQGDRPAQT
ncbi:NAD(P)H-dependent oxidoreductase [Kineosporia sp. NBRC 101731]|uniref:flavodoxin family protein n=1 Tax=Kineosporia sp. NBRC 101731 TaxID=3032199 RepID=UPI0024A3F56B|nr:NAD(P)H-dependent oxidoreductase [Kineosporia sp. NBRC 101731]GLY32338.1 TrpR-binding protein WrbA [Kineosporia sp. NBRC 101731]